MPRIAGQDFQDKMPKLPEHRKALVADMRKAKDAKLAADKARFESEELDEYYNTTGKAWSSLGRRVVGKVASTGFGEGKPGSAGTWVRRNGELVRKDSEPATGPQIVVRR